jgi:hypothetical protein
VLIKTADKIEIDAKDAIIDDIITLFFLDDFFNVVGAKGVLEVFDSLVEPL